MSDSWAPWHPMKKLDGSAVACLSEHFRPDVTIAVDVAHDFVAAPGITDRRYEPLEMGEGFTLTHGAICSASLNTLITSVSTENDIPAATRIGRSRHGNGRDGGGVWRRSIRRRLPLVCPSEICTRFPNLATPAISMRQSTRCFICCKRWMV